MPNFMQPSAFLRKRNTRAKIHPGKLLDKPMLFRYNTLKLSRKEDPAMTTLLLVRHGQSQANLNRTFAGQTNPDLTELGKSQAETLANYLAAHYKIDKIYSSDLLRARHTAAPTARKLGLPITLRKQLREIDAGEWEGKPFDYLQEHYPESYGIFCTNLGGSQCPGGESVAQLAQRVHKELLRICRRNEGKTILVTTHATPIRATQTLCEKGNISFASQVPWTPNTSISKYEYRDGKLYLLEAGFDGYLQDQTSTLPVNV